MKIQFLSLLALASLAFVPAANADSSGGWARPHGRHHRRFEVVCQTKNARGFRFEARNRSRFPNDFRNHQLTQSQADYQCSASGSFICVSLGCQEFMTH